MLHETGQTNPADLFAPAELKMYSLMMTANGHVDPRGAMAPPIIMRTAATPMPTPKSSLGPESILGDELMCRDGAHGEAGLDSSEAGRGRSESRRGSSASMEPLAYDQRSLVRSVRLASTEHSRICQNFCESLISRCQVLGYVCKALDRKVVLLSSAVLRRGRLGKKTR